MDTNTNITPVPNFDNKQEFTIKEEKNEKPEESSLQNYLNKAVTTAGILYKSAKLVAEHGKSIFSGLTLTGIGSYQTLQGNWVTGSTLMGLGFNQLWAVLWSVDDKKIQSLLQDIGAAHSLIKTMAQENKNSCNTIKENLNTVEEFIKANQTKLKVISEISSEGSEEIQQLKDEASNKFKEAQDLLKDAFDEFIRSDSSLSKSSDEFGESLDTLVKLFEKSNHLLAKGNNLSIERKEELVLEFLNGFVLEGKVIEERTSLAQIFLQTGRSHQSRGMVLLTQALHKQNEAAELLGKALEASKQRFERIEELSKQQESVDKEIETIKHELNVLKENNEITEDLVDVASDKLETVQKNLQEKFGYMSFYLGPPVGAAITSLTGIPPTITIPMGVQIVHSREPIYKCAMKLYYWFYGIEEPKPYTEPIELSDSLDFQWNSSSTGYYNHYIAKEPHSWTAGQLIIDLDEEGLVELPFCLNEKDKIPFSEMTKFSLKLNELVKQGKIKPQKCLEIIERLETSEIDRGPKISKEIGFIPKNAIYFKSLRKKCEMIVESQKLIIDLDAIEEELPSKEKQEK